jgi:hypothetical protein
MRNHITCLCMGTLIITGCSGADAGAAGAATSVVAGRSGSSVAGATASSAMVPGVAAGRAASAPTAGTAPTASSPVTTPAPAGSGAASVQPPASTTGGSLAMAAAGGGAPAPTVAAAGGGGTSTTGAAGAGSAGTPGMLATEPVLPPMMGDCPMFDSGSATIMGARLTFLAKKKAEGETKGSLVFYWHGTGSSPLEGSMFAGLDDIMKDGGLVVGFSSGTGSGGDCSGTGEHSIDDFKVADQVVACAVANYGVDPKRVYATGCSAGGLQSGCMSINRSSYIAAVATNSGGVTIGYGPFQDLTRVPNVMTMHGAPGSDVVIVDFSETSEAFDNYMMAKGAFAVECNHGGGHCGAPAALQASAWQFLKDHPFGTHPSPYAAGGLPSSFPKYCKAWTMTDRQPLGEGRGMPMTMP